jgi:hypothetical protein
MITFKAEFRKGIEIYFFTYTYGDSSFKLGNDNLMKFLKLVFGWKDRSQLNIRSKYVDYLREIGALSDRYDAFASYPAFIPDLFTSVFFKLKENAENNGVTVTTDELSQALLNLEAKIKEFEKIKETGAYVFFKRGESQRNLVANYDSMRNWTGDTMWRWSLKANTSTSLGLAFDIINILKGEVEGFKVTEELIEEYLYAPN